MINYIQALLYQERLILILTKADTIFHGAALAVPRGADQSVYMRQMRALRNTYSEFQKSLSQEGEQEQLVSIVNSAREGLSGETPLWRTVIAGILESSLGKDTEDWLPLDKINQ